MLPKVNFVDETEIRPPYVHRKRRAGEQILYFIRHGEMHLLEDGKPLILKPGDVCLLDKDRTHEGTKATTCNYYYVHFMHGGMELVDAKEEEVAKQQFERRRKAMAKEPCEPYGSCDESEIWLPKYWHIKKVTDQIHIDELIKQAIAEDYSTFENHKILCACRIQEALIEIARCFATAEREKSAGGFPESYYKVQKIQEWLNASYAAEISGERLEEEFDGNFDYMNRIFKRVTGQTISIKEDFFHLKWISLTNYVQGRVQNWSLLWITALITAHFRLEMRREPHLWEQTMQECRELKLQNAGENHRIFLILISLIMQGSTVRSEFIRHRRRISKM